MKPKFTDVTLSEPLTIGGKEVTSIRLRRPAPGEMRGLSLMQVMQMNVDAIMKLVPRIAEPVLDEQTLAAMDAADFGEIAGQVVIFFDRGSVAAPKPMTTEATPTT